MKASAEKSSTTTSKTATQAVQQPFFAKSGGGNFFTSIQQSRLVIEDGKTMFRTRTGKLVELPSDISVEEAVKLESEAMAAEQKLGKGPSPKPVPDVKKLAKPEAKKSTQKGGKGKQFTAGKGKVASKSAAAAVAGLKAVGTSKVAQYLAIKGTPALVKGMGALQKLKQNEQTHDDAGEKLRQSEKAVVIPPSEGQSKGNTAQVVTVSDRPPPVADENKGKQKLQVSLRENVPKSIEDVDNFKRDQKAQHMGADVLSVVQSDKGAVISAFNEMENTPPPLPPEHTPENLPPEEIAPPTAVMNLGQGAVVPLQKEHTDLGNFTNEADGKLKEEGVTQEQLDMVDGGDLAEANKEKKGMETKAKTEPLAVESFVRQSATKIDLDLKQEEKKEREGMKAKRKAGLGATTQKQKGAKSALEKKREEVASKINGIYTKAQYSVKKKLADLETVSMKRFDDGNAKATKEFEDNVNREIDAFKDDRYSGWFGWARKAKDWLLGMDDLPEVKAIFDRNRAVFVSTINKLVEDITVDNKRVIQECKDELAAAKQQIKDYVDKLGPDLNDIGRKSAEEMNAKLADMDHFIAKKEQELQDKLKDKQQAAIKAIDEKIEKMKEAMAGALAKLGKLLLLAAKKFFTWALEKAGFSLSDIESIISKGAAVLKAIFTKPIVFVKNLINAAINGFKNFGKNFLKHLQDALFEWLTGSLEGLALPQTWDFKGIVGVALQMIGISYQNIRKHLIEIIGEPVVANLEKTFTLVKTLITEGPMAAWEQLKEMAGEMKEAFLDAVKDFVKTKIIEQAIQWVVSIFVPGAGIVKAVIGIYDTIMFFIQKAKQIMQMIGNFLSAIGDIAAGNIGAAADALENGLARGLSLVIGFLASLLRLGGITNKIKEAIKKIRDKVDAVLAKVAKWIAEKAKKLGMAVLQVGVPADPNERLLLGLQAAVTAVRRIPNTKVGRPAIVAVLGLIKTRYGFVSLEPEIRNGRWWVTGRVNPIGAVDLEKVPESEKFASGSDRYRIVRLLRQTNDSGVLSETEASALRKSLSGLAKLTSQEAGSLEDVEKKAVKQTRDPDKPQKKWENLHGVLQAEWVEAQASAIEKLTLEVATTDNIPVLGLARGGALVAEQLASGGGRAEGIPKPPAMEDENIRRTQHIELLVQRIRQIIAEKPGKNLIITIAETWISGTAKNTVIDRLQKLVEEHTNLKIRLLALRQELGENVKPGQRGSIREGQATRKGKIALTKTEKVQLVWHSVPYIVGEDIDYQNVTTGDTEKSPVIVFRGTEEALIAYQIIPVGEGRAKDIILDLVARKISLPGVLE